LERKTVILDAKGNELDLEKPSIFKFDTTTGVLSVQTNDASYLGVNTFFLAVKLKKHPEKGYFPK
jgi:hypothetical protein